MKYIFNTKATMKRYNEDDWWVESNIVPTIKIEENNLTKAVEKYRDIINEKQGIEISDNAIKTKEDMYIDTKDGKVKQTGYIITGKTLFQNNDYKWVNKYIDLWVEILTVIDTEF